MLEPSIDQLPIATLIPEILSSLEQDDNLVLQAPTGAGKTTAVPLALLSAPWLQDKKIIMLEPRRLAARAAARRMASLLDEAVGETVGYRVSLEHKIGPRTRIEVVTEGVLTRMLQQDPELSAYAVVIFDEFHERSLHADLGLALCCQCQQLYREEIPLRLVVMSATLDGGRIGSLLQEAALLTSAGRSFPVEHHYHPLGLDARQAGLWYDAFCALLRQVAEQETGDILVFLPGGGEIAQLERRARQLHGLSELVICPLYGELSSDQQQQAIMPSPDGHRKLILATSIAETSLTIEGVRVVVDSGLMRRPQFDPVSGMTRLETRRVSKASADQRAGRAGRTEAGVCYRLWSETEQQGLEPFTAPEILEADLTQMVLELASWGDLDPAAYVWLDAPPQPHFVAACQLLEGLQALTMSAHGTLQITPHGEELARLAMHPRLAHMVILAQRQGLGYAACQLAGVLSERDLLQADPQQRDADIMLRMGVMEGEKPMKNMKVRHASLQRARQQSRQWQRQFSVGVGQYSSEQIARLLAWAYPDRIAQQRGSEPERYLLSGGKGAQLSRSDAMAGVPYMVVADLGGNKAHSEAMVFLACEIEQATLRASFEGQLLVSEEVRWDKTVKQVVASRRERLGALVLHQSRLTDTSDEQLQQALLEGVRDQGLQALPWNPASETLRNRIRFAAGFDPQFPALSDDWLRDNLEQWLMPYLGRWTRLEQLKTVDLRAALLALLDWTAQQKLHELAPEHWRVASGSKIRIDYADISAPVLAVRLQEMFGCESTPMIASGQQPLTIQLLSPAQRPVQVTRDLAGFWRGSYHEVRKEMKGRYPKHYWPDNPLQAEATTRTKRHIKS